MSAANSKKGSKAAATISVRPLVHPKAKGDNNYLCTWNVEGDFFASFKKHKSPVFTIPNRDECKWYLIVQDCEEYCDECGGGEREEEYIHFKMQLCLDPSSDCEAAVAKFWFEVYSADKRIALSLQGDLKTSNFIKESVNSSVMKSTVDMYSLQACEKKHGTQQVTVLCAMKVIKVIPEGNSFPNDFGSVLKDKRFTDVSIVVNKKKFPAHKVILSARSSVFSSMFAQNTSENQDAVTIKGISKEIVEEMLRYIYTGEVQKLDEQARGLLVAAVKYDLKELQNKCEKILIESLSSSNAIELLLFADVNNASKLRFEAISLIRKKKTELMKTADWKKLNKSPALVREISEAHPNPKPASGNSESEASDDSESEPSDNSDSESE